MGKLLETERTRFDNTWHSTYGKKCFALLPNTGSFLLLVNTKAHSKTQNVKTLMFFPIWTIYTYTDPRDTSDKSDLGEKYAIFSYHTWNQRRRNYCSNKSQLQSTSRI